ncbi:MAG: hypothetical protein VKJ24_02325 [Synechococcales bacterium]|nr:hypothetical protein [Synechococcales bacterium]
MGWLVIFDRRSNALERVDRLRTEPHQTPKGLNILIPNYSDVQIYQVH